MLGRADERPGRRLELFLRAVEPGADRRAVGGDAVVAAVNHRGALPCLLVGARRRELVDVKGLHVFAELVRVRRGDVLHAVVVQQDSGEDDRKLSAAAMSPECRPPIPCLHAAVQVDTVLRGNSASAEASRRSRRKRCAGRSWACTAPARRRGTRWCRSRVGGTRFQIARGSAFAKDLEARPKAAGFAAARWRDRWSGCGRSRTAGKASDEGAAVNTVSTEIVATGLALMSLERITSGTE